MEVFKNIKDYLSKALNARQTSVKRILAKYETETISDFKDSRSEPIVVIAFHVTAICTKRIKKELECKDLSR
ncbi:hypothetical protein TNCV_2973521 [Trichonephila clavipes]|nr:hypothetical protein TNCV_2973521 [Trichonephila clavipes]